MFHARPHATRGTFEYRLAACAISCLFVASAVGKSLAPHATHDVLTQVHGLHDASAFWLVGALVGVECVIAIALLMASNSAARRVALALASSFIAVATLSIVRQWIQGSTLPCGCGLTGGAAPADSSKAVGVVRNGLLLVLGCTAWVSLSGDPRSPAPSASLASTPGD